MKSPVYRLFVERKAGFENEARRTFRELTGFLGIGSLEGVRYLNRYDVEGIDGTALERAVVSVFSEPQGDVVYRETFPISDAETVIATEYLPGQYDQRADSAAQCLALLGGATGDATGTTARGNHADGDRAPDGARSTVNGGAPLTVRCARLFVLRGKLSASDLKKITDYLINPVDSRKASADKPDSLAMRTGAPGDIPTIDAFRSFDAPALESFRAEKGLAMDNADLAFLRDYFVKEGRDPTETEIRVLDTYWSDHCRHTTFNTILERVDVADGPYAETFRRALDSYSGIRAELYAGRDKPVTLMDMAVIGAKALKKRGLLADVEESAEINACSVFIDVKMTDAAGNVTGSEPWLLMFKNETHNHPTEIEPFGGAATCIGGAIRDPLSGRAWVYQALRVTGAGDPTVPLSETIPGKLPQIKLTREAAAGFSAYGNQIGLATGQVVEYYDPGFLAKRMELGAVIAATPVSSVVREEPEAGDVVIMVGGGTGRDGIGGATGSSKVHTAESVTTAGAEVQKGNAVEERKIQRLFRDPAVTTLIRRCNDFGAGGVAVAVGELASGLDIDLDAVPKKYEGLNGTELAISESQERMAVVVRARDAEAFSRAAARENLNAAIIAKVTSNNRLVMRWRGRAIVDIDRAFLDTAGASRSAKARIEQPAKGWDWTVKSPAGASPVSASPVDASPSAAGSPAAEFEARWLATLSDLSVASQRGLGERFDGSIGSASVLFPEGGAWQSTPECGMAARIPVAPGKRTVTTSLMAMGYDPRAARWSPFHGAQYAVLESLAKILALGGDPRTARLSFQEYFERTVDPASWGKPAAALLGALEAQLKSGAAAIGGKDSMSGTFHDLRVPPTLVSFAVAVTDDARVRGGALTAGGHALMLVRAPFLADDTPDWDAFRANVESVLALGEAGVIRAAYPVTAGGIAAALSKMAFGNRVGAKIDSGALPFIALPSAFAATGDRAPGKAGHFDALFAPLYGSLILELSCDVSAIASLANGTSTVNWVALGKTIAEPEITVGATRIPLDRAQMAWEKPLASVFPPVSGVLPSGTLPEWARVAEATYAASATRAASTASPAASATQGAAQSAAQTSAPMQRRRPASAPKAARPLVVLPVFPGTNCEYDMARAFRVAGADTEFAVIRNGNAAALAESLAEFREKIDRSHILAFSGGFSAGDEPDGSGKFIANVIREARIADGIMELFETRKGLILGICNGFQALIKTGLVPYGKILPPSEDMPTLTYNLLGRHVSRFVSARIASDSSPWANDPGLLLGKIHRIPVSHGEGRVIIGERLARDLFARGQVFTQYADADGRPTINEPDNPNGSMYAIEGLTDPSGRILGKMGHNERPVDASAGARTLYGNIPGDTCQNIFAAGVRYWKD